MRCVSSAQDDLLHLCPHCNISDKTASGKRQQDLGMFVDIMGTLYNLGVFNEFGLLAETNSRLGKLVRYSHI